jgi:hypothetical protein
MRVVFALAASALALTACKPEPAPSSYAPPPTAISTVRPSDVPAPYRLCQAVHAGFSIAPDAETAADLRNTCTLAALQKSHGPCFHYAVAASALGAEPTRIELVWRADDALAECAEK